MNEMHEEDLRLLAHQALKSHDTYSPESIRAVVKAKASLLGCSESAV